MNGTGVQVFLYRACTHGAWQIHFFADDAARSIRSKDLIALAPADDVVRVGVLPIL